MEKKVALLVIYNHRFDKNIPIVQRLYSKRFSNIYHIVPFYDGKVEGANVIPVYESSYYFQGYISQAYSHISGMGYTHFLIIADDLILNPEINEHSLWEKVGISDKDCFVPAEPIVLQEHKDFWSPLWEGLKYKVNISGVEVKNILPSREEALVRFKHHNIPTTPVPYSILFRHWKYFLLAIKKIPWNRRLNYPLVGCYSDTFLVTADVMDNFCKYCGAFAATNLFVELAIPTSLVLSTNNLKFDKDIKLHYGAFWPNTIGFLDKYENSLDKLINDYPEDMFFVHPVKLSKWTFSQDCI